MMNAASRADHGGPTEAPAATVTVTPATSTRSPSRASRTSRNPRRRATDAAAGEATTGISLRSARRVGRCAWSSHPCERRRRSHASASRMTSSASASRRSATWGPRPTYSAGRFQNVRSPTNQGSQSTRARARGKCTRQPLPPRYVKTSSRGDDADARASRPSAEARATRGEGRRDARARGGRTRRGDAVARAKDADDIPASRRRARARKWSRRFAATSLSGGVTAHPISQQSSISPRRPLSLYMDGRALPHFPSKTSAWSAFAAPTPRRYPCCPSQSFARAWAARRFGWWFSTARAIRGARR